MMISLTLAVCLALTINIEAFAPHLKASLKGKPHSGDIRRGWSLFDSASASTTIDDPSTRTDNTRLSRVLGSQELLMAPRQYSPGDAIFPSMNHVWVVRLSATPSLNALEQAIEYVMESHPLLRAYIQGDGEPEKRIDGLQMVRSGEPNPMTFVSEYGKFSAKDVLKVVDVPDKDALDASWKAVFARDMDDGYWCNVQKGPLWKVELHRIPLSPNAPCALVFTSNHAISDQGTANRMTDQLLRRIVDIESGKTPLSPPVKQKMPLAVEDSVLGLQQRWSDVQADGVKPATIRYVADKALEGFRNPVILPDDTSSSSNLFSPLATIFGKVAGGKDEQPRKTTLQFRSLSQEATSALLSKCREQGVSMTDALTAAMTLTATDFVDSGVLKEDKTRNYKVLQSMDLRRFGAQLDQGETMACMAGSMDLMHGPLQDRSGETLRRRGGNHDLFWKLAREGKKQTTDFIASDGPEHAVRIFDFAMTISDLNNLVYLTAQSKDTKGRAYSAGLTNVGVYERQKAFQNQGDSGERELLQIQHGRYKVEDIFFGSPHSQSGCLYICSCLTVNGEFKFTFHPACPIVSEQTNQEFADAFVELLEVVSGTRSASVEKNPLSALTSILPENALTLAATVIGGAAVLSHTPAWVNFFQSVAEMKANVADPADFWAALNFWIFFAVGHPILQPILWLSDVLHGSPGPRIADLVPATFLAGNLIVIYAIQKYKDIRNAVNIAVLAAFFTYVGAGLDGTAGLGDYNLALDDSYKGQIVKGCPAYDQVRQPSMDGFDLDKYQGLWYEQKFHDWTQFKEVYDTTLKIALIEGGRGWVDDFAVKGPAPDAAPKSWQASPVANGAHYFLFGRVDERDPPGILREKGFGVEFPNYIVDVQKNPKTGEYTEAIQFQCLERGGVRVFEGINFMSRNEFMTEAEMEAMHARAEKAGMYPFGAAPEQMHTVARRPSTAPEIDNEWQAFWRAIGFDKLLELLTESIEDGGR